MSEAGRARPARILPVIVASQFAGTSLWFAGNAVVGDLQEKWGLAADAVGHTASAVQAGFICGTLVFAFLSLSDRYSPRKLFFVCSLLGAAANLGVHVADGGLDALLASRFLTGFFLAGVYPVGMRIAAGWYRSGLGHAIGLLVGALVLGTAFPHALKAAGHALPWEAITIAVSMIAAAGGALMLWLVPDGPYVTTAARFDPRALAKIFRSRAFRASAFGYFGHMWELYAFWAFVPVVLAAYAQTVGGGRLDVPLCLSSSSAPEPWAARSAGSCRSEKAARPSRSRNSSRRESAARYRRSCLARRSRSFSRSWWCGVSQSSSIRRNSRR